MYTQDESEITNTGLPVCPGYWWDGGYLVPHLEQAPEMPAEKRDFLACEFRMLCQVSSWNTRYHGIRATQRKEKNSQKVGSFVAPGQLA